MERFASLRYPVHTATLPLDRAFPDLFKHKEFIRLRLTYRKDWEKVVRYIIFLYDHGSDLVAEFQGDLKGRKEAAAMEAGFVRKPNGKWDKALQSIMEVQDQDALAAIMCFLKIQKNEVWTDIAVTEQEYDQFQALRMTGFEAKKGEELNIFEAGKKKDFLMEACARRLQHLKNRYAEFYADHKDVQAAEYVEQITPENALRILSGSKPWEEVDEPAPIAETESVQAN